MSTFFYDNHLYFLGTSGTWIQAQADAQSRNGNNLVTVNNQNENNWLTAVFTAGNNSRWLGYSDQVVEGTWAWSNGDGLNYLNWSFSEPNNFGGNEDYAELTNTGSWNDVASTIIRQGIVEVANISVYNGHSYLLSTSGTWTQAETLAQSLGGHLVTVNNQAENDWLTTNFANVTRWIGYSDQLTEGSWLWSNGESSAYTHWSTNEPNNSAGNEDFAEMVSNGFWNDVSSSLVHQGIIEINATPSLTAFTGYVASGNEDSEILINLSSLTLSGNESDEATIPRFVIKTLSSGSLKIGSSAATATAYALNSNDTIDATHNAYWTAASHANGVLNAFTVVAKDGDGLESPTPVQASVNVNAVNDAPTLTAFAAPVASGNEDTEIPINLSALQAQGNEADLEDVTLNQFVIKAVSSGSLKIGSSAQTATVYNATTNNIVDSTHNLYWTPALNANGSLNAFTAVAKDSAGAESLIPVQASVAVNGINDPPTFTAFAAPVASGDEDTEIPITLSALQAQGNEADLEDSVVSQFVINAINSGNLKIGSSAQTATAYQPISNNTVDSSHNLYWTPALNANGILNAFSVVAKDSAGAESFTLVQANVNVNAVNDAPTLTAFATPVASGYEDAEIPITLSALKTQGDEADPEDGAVNQFVIKSVSSGSLRIGANATDATAYNATTNNTVDSTHNLYWTPALNVNGILNAFSVVAKDNAGAESLTPVQAKVGVNTVNDAPTLTAFAAPVASGNENAEIQITLSALQAQGDENDLDGTVNQFVIKAVNSGTLRIGANASDATAYDASVNNTVDSSHNLYWTPAANANGLLNAFSVVAKDSAGAESLTPVQAKVDVTPLPSVSIAVSQQPAEGSMGLLTVNLDSPAPVGGLTINYDLMGTATQIDDYTLTAGNNITALSSNRFTIAQGQSSATLNLNALTDNVVDDAETMQLTLLAGSGYVLMSSDNFAPKVDYATDVFPISVSSGDFNGDDRLDLAVANVASNTVSVLLRNTSNTSFESKVNYATSSGSISVSSGDFNGDGRLDLAVANAISNTVSVMLRNASNTSFELKIDYPTGLYPHSVSSGDFNGDGRLDLVVANSDSDTVSVLLRNTSNTSFEPKIDYPSGLYPYSVTSGDFNGDGRLDLAVVNAIGNKVSVLLRNASNTSFEPKIDYPTGMIPSSVSSGDFDGDGRLDLVVANSDSDTVSVLLRNTSNTSFEPKVDYSTGIAPYSVTNGDFNGDGRLDLVVANYFSNTISLLLRNASNSSFEPKVDYSTGSNPYSVSSGDFNGDGKLDLAAANNNSHTVSILENSLNSFATVTITDNIAPSFSTFSNAVSKGNQNSEISVLFSDLQVKGNEKDSDGTVSGFVVKEISSGQLKIGSSAQTASAWQAGSNDTIDSTHNGYWLADNNASGKLDAFTVVAKDNVRVESETPVQAQISVTALDFTNNDDNYTGNTTAQTLDALAGDDTVLGNAGNDTIIGGTDDDTLSGGSGRDVLYAGAVGSLTSDDGDNKLLGGSGNDTLVSGSGDDTLNGGSGVDTASYALATSAVQVNLSLTGEQNTGGAGFDTLKSLENLIGGTDSDSLTGNSKANVLTGGLGNDSLNGGAGADTAVFTGNFADYQFSRSSGNLVVTDKTANRDGIDLLNVDIETVQFTDGSVTATTLAVPTPSAYAKYSTDFNGDHKSDLLLTHTDGSVRAITLNALSSTADAVVYNAAATSNGAWQVINSKGDYDGDGKTDLLLWNSSTSSAKIAFMNGAAISSESTLTDIANPSGWTIADSTADYNNDGKSDVLWWNASSHSVNVYLHDGGSVLAAAQLFADTGAGWVIQSAGGDYNGDGKGDIFFWSQSLKVAYLATMDGVSISSSGYLTPGAGWSPIDVKGDYNGDGNSDIIWRNDSTGELWEYQMNGTTISNNASLGTVPLSWTVVDGNSDFNGDGKADILWKNSDGSAGVSLMDGMTMGTMTNLGAFAGRTVQNADNDVNADGKADILWTQTDGTVYVMEMDGVSIIGQSAIGTYSGWSVLSV